MPNLTIYLQDEEYRFIRAYAANNRTSASALVADFIFSLKKVAKVRKRIYPRDIVDAHCTLASKSDNARVNSDPRTAWDFMNIARKAIKEAQEERNQAVVDASTEEEML